MLRRWLQRRRLEPLSLLLWSVSVCGWLSIAAVERVDLDWSALCGSGLDWTFGTGARLVDFMIGTSGWHGLAAGAALMVMAMMAPALAGPLLHLWHRSLSRHRWRAIALFAVGYLATWMIACALLIAAAHGLQALTRSALATGSTVALAGLAWQVSPLRARCLARCHLRPRLSIFGLAAVTDPLVFGVTLAGWCVATCWALMLLPFCLPQLHLPLMAAASLLIAIERNGPRQPRRSRLVDRLMARVGGRGTTTAA